MTKVWAGLLALGAIGGGAAVALGLASSDGPPAGAGVGAGDGVVTRLVDGDTFDARVDGEILRIRLLNIDTPETKDPDRGVQCLGPEASARLASLIPVGTPVRLEYDVERVDQYGRTLAGVFVAETFVNAELARAGLAVPVLFGENDRYYTDVVAAYDQAAAGRRGFFDPGAGCAAPG